MSEIEEPTPFLRGQDFGQAARACDLASAACCDGRIAVLPGSANELYLRVTADGPIAMDAAEAEFLAGILLAYARRNTPKGTVKVPDIQPNSI